MIILEIYLINCEINYILTWSADCVIKSCAIDQSATFAVTDKKLYVPIVALSTEDNAKLLQRLKSGFKKAINRNKYQTKVITQAQNQYLDYLIDPTFQEVKRLFVLLYEVYAYWKSYKRYFLPTVEIKDYTFMIDGRNFFNQPVENDIRT